MAYLSEDRRSESGQRSSASDAADFYLRLRSRPGERGRDDDDFSAHVFACALAVSLAEIAESGASLASVLGLGRSDLARLLALWAPAAAELIDLASEPEQASFDEEEDQLRQLLERFRADADEETSWIIAIVAKRSMSPRHLWQDLGLVHRDELGRLIGERFPKLAERNVNHMKWKKFFYRSLCEMEGFVLCASPTCQECGDFHDCFGDESGASVLARIANQGRSGS
jgi:nitrogen fixation protein NifQ